MFSPDRRRLAALYLLVIAIWGTTWIAIKASVASIPPLTASGLRFAIAFPLLAIIVARTPGAALRYPRGRGGLFALVTLAYFAAPYALMNLGGAAIPSGLAAVLFATVSIFIVGLSVPVLGAAISRRQACGVAVALAALVALIVNQAGVGGSVSPFGVAALLAAAVLHAVVYVLLKRDAGAISPLTLNALPMGLAGLLLCAAGAAFERPDLSAITGESLTALLYLGTVASVAGFLAYFQLLRRLGPVPLSLVFVFFPVVAQVVAVLGGERPMGGVSLALLGLVLTASLVALTGASKSRHALSGARLGGDRLSGYGRQMHGLRRLAAITVLLLVAAAAPTARASIPAPPSQWYGLPGLNAASGAQWVRALAYSTPPNIVYAGLEGGGVFKSETGGATWSAFNTGFPNPLTTNVRALLASSTGTTVYAGTDSGIFKSTGGAWAPLAQGAEDDPSNPKKLNQSVQALVSLTGSSVMLAGVFSGGVYKSSDGGDTWSPPPANSGMPASETIYGLTENIPGLVYATGGSGVYVSTNQGSTWSRISDGIPGSASPITTWAYPQQPQILFTSTGSNGIYRSLNGGITWAPINSGLGAVRARGLQIFTAAQGAHLYAATEDGLWEALQENSLAPTQPNWHKVTQEGLIESSASNVIMWALTTPVIPGSGGLGLIAGTQSNGGYFLSFEPPDSPCPTNHTTNTTTNCPHLADTTPEVGKALALTNVGAWTGTPLIEYAYQWQRCTSTTEGSCGDIPDAEESSYIVPASGQGAYFRIEVTATNPAPTFGVVKRYSAITSITAASPTTRPGYNQTDSPGIVVLSPGETTAPSVGDTMYAANGSLSAADPTYGWFNPAATTVSYRWLRCDGSGLDCNEIPGATSRSYTLQSADGTHDLRVRVTGTGSGYSTELTSPASYDVTSLPAAIADPFPNPDGGDPLSQAPSLAGNAWVGETLAGSVGGWKDPTTDFLRRWVRCDADGTACTYIQQVASTDPETGPTYVVRPDDLGYTLRLRVTADVNNDLTPDGTDNHLPHAVEVDTPPSAAVTNKPVPGGGPPPPAGGGGTDTTAPVISGVSLSKKTFVAGKLTTFKFLISEGASVRIVISRKTTGRKVGTKCKPKTRKNRHRRKCTFQKTLLTIRRQTLPAGAVSIPFNGKIGKRKLKPGRYLATIIVTDAAGNVARAKITFKIVRR